MCYVFVSFVLFGILCECYVNCFVVECKLLFDRNVCNECNF